MESLLVTKENITEYIPQKDPIVMIDTLNSSDGPTTKTTLTIREDNIFVKEGVMQEPGLIENMAQSIAVKAGYEAKMQGGEPLIGFIGAVKDLKIKALPKVGQVVNTTVTVKMEVMGVTLIDAVTNCDEKEIASCEMKIFIQKPEDVNG